MKLKFKLQEYIEDREFNAKDKSYLGVVSDEFAEDIKNLFSEFIEKDLDEQFTSPKTFNDHFRWHCLGKNKNKKSSRQNVYYDFTNANDYSNYERKISYTYSNPDVIVLSLLDTESVIKAFRELFEGGKIIKFATSCELKNENGAVNIYLHSFATEATENYTEGNTVDFAVVSKNLRTISLYPVDANYLENKFNNVVAKHSKNKQIKKFLINH